MIASRSRIRLSALALVAFFLLVMAAAWLGYQSAHAEAGPAGTVVIEPMVDAGTTTGHPYRDAGVPDLGDPRKAVVTAPPVDPGLLDQLTEVKAQYDALKAARAAGDPTILLWAGLIATVLKLLLSTFNRFVFAETKKWTKWLALGAAVPIALLSYYALGNGLFESLIYAGSGPGAIIVHELLQRKPKADA